MSSPQKPREPWALFKSFIALLLIMFCLWGSQWQYHRGVDRHARKAVIQDRIVQSPIELKSVSGALDDYEWQTVSVEGVFDSGKQILLRNRYNDGKYGYEVLTLFKSTANKSFWVDRGWVQAGATATTPPVVTEVPTSQVSITGRFRLDS
jgi:surfeit locus 1 family protein